MAGIYEESAKTTGNPDGGKRISTRFMVHCNVRMAALRSERWRSRQLLLFSDRRSDAPPPAKLLIGRPTPPPKGRLMEQRHSSSQPLFIISESLPHLLPRRAFSFSEQGHQRPRASCGSSSLSSPLSDERVTPSSRTGRLNGKTEASRVSAISWIVARSGTAPETVLLRVA